MRLLLAALLLAPCLAFGASTYPCNDGVHTRPSNEPTWCPPTLTAMDVTATSDTAVTVTAITDTAASTCYAAATLTSTTPHWRNIKSGSGAEASNTSDLGSGNISFSVTGLAEATAYYVHLACVSDAGWVSLIATHAVTTLANPDVVSGYFVDSVDGNNANSGLTLAQAWRDMPESGLATADDVFVRAGSTFSDYQYVVPISGSSSDQAVFGCAYDNAGTTERCTAAQSLPIFDGTYESSCRDTQPYMTCTLNAAAAVPSSIYAGLIELNGVNYVTIEFWHIKDSAGIGIDLNKNSTGNVVRNNLIQYSAFNDILADDGSLKVAYVGNTTEYGADCERQQDQGDIAPGSSWGNCGTAAQPSCVKIASSQNSYSLVQGNEVFNCAGEGMGFGKSDHIWVDQNIVGNTGVSIYGDHSDRMLITRNLVWGAGDQDGANQNQSGIFLGLEGTAVGKAGQGGGYNFVGANIAVGTVGAFGLRNINSASATAGLKQWGLFYFNTGIATQENAILTTGGGSSAVGTELDVQNNIAYVDDYEACSALPNGTFDYNLYPSTPSDSDCNGANDVVDTLTFSHTMSAFRAATRTNITSDWGITDYTPTGGSSPHLSAGSSITLPTWLTDLADSAEWDRVRNYSSTYFPWSDGNCDGTLNSSVLLLDANCDAIPGSTPDLGASQLGVGS